ITVPEWRMDADGNDIPDSMEHLFISERPLYTGNINMSAGDSLKLIQISPNGYDVNEDNLKTNALSLWTINDTNEGGYTGKVVWNTDTGNLQGKLIFSLNGDSDKIVSTTASLGNVASSGTKYIKDLDFTTHNGDDVFVIGRDVGLDNVTGKGITVNTQGGDDIFIAGASNSDHKVIYGDDGLRVEDSAYSTKTGEFSLNLQSYQNAGDYSGGIIHDSRINMGDGNDTFIHFGSKNSVTPVENTDINMEGGNDAVILFGDISGKSVNILGGSGFDTLTHNWGNIVSKDISGFETLNLGNKSALKLYADYLTKDGGIEGGILKINGESGTSVDLGNNGNNLSDNNGTWTKGEAKSEEGVNYHVYRHSANPDVQVWIDDDIKQVI
ncbi:hypothetical protein, partial [Escherichia coli]|uniref:hypothetical protein n=1 Tax=Escherichia coli TaxID=562 RepID=UPI001BEB6984